MPAETHTRTPPPDPADLSRLAVVRLSESLGRDPADLRPETVLVSIGAEELVVIDVLASLEEDLGERTLSGDLDLEIQELETVGDFAEHVVRRFA